MKCIIDIDYIRKKKKGKTIKESHKMWISNGFTVVR